MAKASTAKPDQDKIVWLDTDDLYLDERNPRLAGGAAKRDQQSLLAELWQEGALDELGLSIAENGFFPEEPLFVVEEKGKWIVVEGNRRLATVKLLRSKKLQASVRAELPQLSGRKLAELESLPVSIYPNRKSLWAYVGFRHVNGPMTWDSWSKAQYIAQVHNDFGISLADIAQSIGDKNQTVMRLYRGLMILNQSAEQAGYDLSDRSKKHLSFSHLYTGLDYAGFQAHLGLGKDDGYKPNPIKKSFLPNLRELMVWLFGSREDEQPAVIRSQNPDLKRLDDVLKDKKALAALRSGLGLQVSHEISLGDVVRFRDILTRIKYDLQQAKGLALHGYKGDPDLRRTARDISELADSLLEEMSQAGSPRRKASLK
jgi:hypothetical protein